MNILTLVLQTGIDWSTKQPTQPFSHGGSTNTSSGGSIVILVIAVIVIAVIALFRESFETSREEQTRGSFAARGFKVSGQLVDEADLPPIEEICGRSYNITWSATGTIDGYELTVFEHRYRKNHGRRRRTHRHAVLCFRLPTQFPAMSVYEPGWLETLGDMFGDPYPDNDVPFIRNRYRVACRDAVFVKAILNNAITSEMMSWSGGEGSTCAATASGSRTTPNFKPRNGRASSRTRSRS